jgi:hypothetical protein
MNLMRTVILAAALLAALAAPSPLRAESLSAAQEEALQGLAVSLYPGSSFTTGDDGDGLTVLWFKSADSPAKIMSWYRQQLPGWIEIETNGVTVLYKGPAGLDVKDLSDKPYIFTRSTTESEPVMSEITVRIPK